MPSDKTPVSEEKAIKPESILHEDSAQAQILHISDAEATILICHAARCDSTTCKTKSIFKLLMVPAHRKVLPIPVPCSSLEALNALPLNDLASQQILDFLRKLDFRLKSESGAEYSYHDAVTKTNKHTDNVSTPCTFEFQVELISPASGRQIERCLPEPVMVMVEETPEMYEFVVLPYIERQIKSGSVSWIQNVIDGKKETERLLLQDPDFILNVDTKWKTHPDANSVSRDSWYAHTSVQDLYCLAIVRDYSLRTIRDLRQHHVPLLRNILERSRQIIHKVYGIKSNQMRIFFHYHPQFYHLHVHFTRLEYELGCAVERGHLLMDVIQNIELDSMYYAKRTMTYKLKQSSELYQLLHND